MSYQWIKVLSAIMKDTKFFRHARVLWSVDVEVSNLQDLITELTQLPNQWARMVGSCSWSLGSWSHGSRKYFQGSANDSV